MKKRDIALAFGGAIGAAVAIKMLTRAKTVDWEAVADQVPHSDHSHFAEVDGATVHYQEFGDPAHPTILLIHGYTASVYVWKDVMPLLADEGFHVVAPDLIGFGYSDKPRWFEYTIDAQARIISRFMNRLGIGRAVIVGSSYGGAVAATLALDYAERVEKLVLIDAVINDGPKNIPIMRLASLPGIGEALTPFVLDSKAQTKSRMYNSLSPTNYHLITRERVESVNRPLAAADAHHSVLTSARHWHADRIERDAPLIEQQTLIIWGEEDRTVPIRDGYSLHNSVLHSRMVVLPNCGHVPAEEKPAVVTSLINEFCRDKKGRLAEHKGEDIKIAGL